MAAHTRWVEVALYLSAGRWAVTWVVLSTTTMRLMFAPDDAKWLGQVLVHMAEEATWPDR